MATIKAVLVALMVLAFGGCVAMEAPHSPYGYDFRADD